jgi:hypothetical protein
LPILADSESFEILAQAGDPRLGGFAVISGRSRAKSRWDRPWSKSLITPALMMSI